jgi:hypothetical protein
MRSERLMGLDGEKQGEGRVGFVCSEEMGLWQSVYIGKGRLLQVVNVRRG